MRPVKNSMGSGVFCTMITSAMLFFFVCAATAQTVETDKKKDFTKVRPGMSEQQVVKLVGDPERKERFKTLKRGTQDTTAYWSFEQDITVIFRNHYVESVERNRNNILLKLQEWADPKNKDSVRVIYGK